MNFPNIIYKCPGTHQCHGGTYDYRGVNDQAQLDSFLDAGWSETLPEAMKKHGLSVPESPGAFVAPPTDEDAPTRAELEIKALELGIKFKKTTADEELSRKIAEALEE